MLGARCGRPPAGLITQPCAMRKLMSNPVQMLDQTFGRWTVVAGPIRKSGKLYWSVRCACGKVRERLGSLLRAGLTLSCGCSRHAYGLSQTPAYRSWARMMDRCYRPDADSYPNYGGRGIAVCDRWHTFENFLADMGERPDGMEIDRKDNTLSYFKENCRWITKTENAWNKRNNTLIAYAGREVCLAEAAVLSGINYSTLRARVARGDADPFRSVRKINHPQHKQGA